MPNSSHPPLRPLTATQVVEAALQIFRVTFAKCLPYATLAAIALQISVALSIGRLLTLYDPAANRLPLFFRQSDPVQLAWVSVGAIVAAFVWMILGVATLTRQSAIASRRPTSGLADLLEVLRRAPAITALALLSGAATDALFIPIMMLAEPYRDAGVLLMMIPALYANVLLFMLPACGVVLEQKSMLASIAGSFRLVRGNAWRVLGVYAIGMSILMVVYMLTAVVAAMVLPYASQQDGAFVMAIFSAAQLAVGALGLIFFTALTLAVVRDLASRSAPAS